MFGRKRKEIFETLERQRRQIEHFERDHGISMSVEGTFYFANIEHDRQHMDIDKAKGGMGYAPKWVHYEHKEDS